MFIGKAYLKSRLRLPKNQIVSFYHLEPAFETAHFVTNSSDEIVSTKDEYVILSTVRGKYYDEVFMFSANENGEVKNDEPLYSLQCVSEAEFIDDMDYEVV